MPASPIFLQIYCFLRISQIPPRIKKTTQMKMTFLCIGKTHHSFLKEGEAEYLTRVQRYLKIERIEIPDLKHTKTMSIEEIKKKEAQLLLAKVAPTDEVVLLDERGKNYSSIQFAQFVQQKIDSSLNTIFIVGGAYGFSPTLYQRANSLLCLSHMTFSHQMVRMIFFEQLYRACTILKNHPYHHQ